MALYLLKNSLAITFIAVYAGIEMTMPKTPNKLPKTSITIKISKGCDFMLLEKMIGWLMKLSISWAIVYPAMM